MYRCITNVYIELSLSTLIAYELYKQNELLKLRETDLLNQISSLNNFIKYKDIERTKTISWLETQVNELKSELNSLKQDKVRDCLKFKRSLKDLVFERDQLKSSLLVTENKFDQLEFKFLKILPKSKSFYNNQSSINSSSTTVDDQNFKFENYMPNFPQVPNDSPLALKRKFNCNYNSKVYLSDNCDNDDDHFQNNNIETNISNNSDNNKVIKYNNKNNNNIESNLKCYSSTPNLSPNFKFKSNFQLKSTNIMISEVKFPSKSLNTLSNPNKNNDNIDTKVVHSNKKINLNRVRSLSDSSFLNDNYKVRNQTLSNNLISYNNQNRLLINVIESISTNVFTFTSTLTLNQMIPILPFFTFMIYLSFKAMKKLFIFTILALIFIVIFCINRRRR